MSSISPRLQELLVAVIVFVFCGVVAFLTTTFSKAPDLFIGNGMQPRNFPLFLMLLTAIINVLLIRQILKAPPRQLTAHSYHTWGTIALMVVFYLVTVFADMMLAISLVVFSLCILWGERRLWVAALLAVLTPGTIFLFFDLVLQIRFPKGILTNLYYG